MQNLSEVKRIQLAKTMMLINNTEKNRELPAPGRVITRKTTQSTNTLSI